MRTYLGLSQRSTNGRFLYGRVSNYRLRPCLLSEINYNDSLATMDPITGDAPLSVDGDVAAATPDSLTPGIQNDWPAPAAGGMSSPNTAGGIAVQNTGYARVASPAPITVSKVWEWGDGTTDAVAFGSTTAHIYAAGTFTPKLVCTDALARVHTQVLADVTTGPAAPTAPAAVGGALQISLSWAAAATATSYNVYRSATSGGALTLIANVAGLAYVNTPLLAGATWYYKIAGVSAVGEGALSAEVTATTNP